MNHTEDPYKNARSKAIQLLARREHSARELKFKLEGRGYDAETVSRLVEQLEVEGLLSNTRYASEKIRALVRAGYGKNYILSAVKEKGVTINVAQIDDVLSELGLTELSLIEEMLRKLNRMSLDSGRIKNRLIRRGFPLDLVNTAIGAICISEGKKEMR